MANYRAVATGNWSNGATWAGGAVPPNGEGHNIYSNNFTVTIDQNVDVALITNAAITASFVGGGTSAAAGGGFTANAGFTISSNVTSSTTSTATALIFNNGGNNTLNGNVTAANANIAAFAVIVSSGALSVNGNIVPITGNFTSSGAIRADGTAALTITGNIGSIAVANAAGLGNRPYGVFVTGTASLQVNNATITGSTSSSINSPVVSNTTSGITFNNCILNGSGQCGAIEASGGTLTTINCVHNAGATACLTSSSTNRFSGTFVASSNGTQPINATRWILNSSPTASYIQHALDGINANSFVRFFTADNSLGQANPTDVRSGVSYASGNLTGRLTIPARGTVTNGVTVGPNMPFTATRSGTTATATLTYSYPYQAGDVITVTGASNNEWNGDYTITEVVSGTSVRWTVPATHSATAGTGANAQTKGTAVLDGSSVAAAVWGAATRTLTSASGPTAVEIRQEMDTNSTKLANLDATVSSRLAASAVNTTRLANVATVESTGAALAAALTAP